MVFSAYSLMWLQNYSDPDCKSHQPVIDSVCDKLLSCLYSAGQHCLPKLCAKSIALVEQFRSARHCFGLLEIVSFSILWISRSNLMRQTSDCTMHYQGRPPTPPGWACTPIVQTCWLQICLPFALFSSQSYSWGQDKHSPMQRTPIKWTSFWNTCTCQPSTSTPISPW